MYELLICNKESGKIWNVFNITPDSVEYSTERMSAPGKLTFSIIMSDELAFEEGDIVRFSVDSQLIFYGFIFTRERDRWGIVHITCYDRLRYLKANASYAFYAATAGDIIKQIAEDLQVDIGTIENTGYRIPSLIASDQACIDTIQNALNQTLLNTGVLYTLYDNGTGLSLKSSGEWFSDIILGDKSYLTDYRFTTDIDTNVYNSVKLAQPNQKTGRMDVVIAEDSYNMGKWGKLQLYQSVDGTLNTAQLAARAKQTLKYYNRLRKTLSLSAMGVNGLRAGMMVRVMIPEFTSWVLIESVTHSYSNDDHFMELEVYELT